MAMHLNENLDDNGEMHDINVTPFIDVMLVLLIIFIVTMPVIQHSVKINLPQASTQMQAADVQSIQVSLNADGQVYWNEAPVDQTALSQLIQQTGAQGHAQIHVRADKNTAYQHIAALMAQIQNSGVHKVSLITTPN